MDMKETGQIKKNRIKDFYHYKYDVTMNYDIIYQKNSDIIVTVRIKILKKK